MATAVAAPWSGPISSVRATRAASPSKGRENKKRDAGISITSLGFIGFLNWALLYTSFYMQVNELSGVDLLMADLKALEVYASYFYQLSKIWSKPLLEVYDPRDVATYFICRPHVVAIRLLEIVLHWHIIGKQSFPLEMPSYPKLWKGSYTKWECYTVEDAYEIVK
ncbi:hypothetical protein K1719_001303 [Acacia pycnantha]|nr:hypothetical protein K1719_001303 [Acacia pycnantha]